MFLYLEPGISGTTLIEGAISQSLLTKLKKIPVFPSPKSNAIADAEGGKDAVPLSLYCYSMATSYNNNDTSTYYNYSGYSPNRPNYDVGQNDAKIAPDLDFS